MIQSDANLGWAAGLFDGEGWVGLVRQKNGGYRGAPRYLIYAEVVNTHLPTIERFAAIVGVPSHVYACRNQSKGAHYKPLWSWKATARLAEGVLRLLMPHLTTKREQAEIVVATRAHLRRQGSTRCSFSPAAAMRDRAQEQAIMEVARGQLSALKAERFEWPVVVSP